MAEPFLLQYEPTFGDEAADAASRYLRGGGWVTEFKETERFEEALAARCQVGHCHVVTSGTAGLMLALMAVDVGPEHEVIVPDLTMIATPNAARMLGARVVLADLDPATLCSGPEQVEPLLTERTRAVLSVSLNGRSPDLARLRQLCDERGVFLIEDAAQSLGSCREGRPLGSFGHLAVLSFSPQKIVSTGQGGAVLTDDAELADRVARLKDFGRLSGGHDVHEAFGLNFKFTDLQSVVGLTQLARLEERLAAKRQIWAWYRERLAGRPGLDLVPTPLPDVAPWFMDIFVDGRDALAAHLKQAGVGTRPIYPAVHTQPIYGGGTSGFPVASRVAARGLWLPSSPGLREADVERVCAAIATWPGTST